MLRDLELYSAFTELSNYSSLSEAAKAMHISQPALSAKLSALESSLGVRLLTRTNRGFSLTSEGRTLLDHLKPGFAQIEIGKSRLRELAGLESGTMRIGASDMTLRFFLLDRLESFHKNHPGVRLAVTNAPTPQTLEALKNGLIDFCVISEPVNTADTAGICFVPVRKIQDIFVCSELRGDLLDHPVSEKELSEVPLILLGKETSTRRYIDSFFDPGTLTANIELATSDLLLEFARRGMGVACIVSDFAESDLESGRLFRVKLENELPPRNFLLAWSKKLPLPPAAAKFIEVIQNDHQISRDNLGRH